MKKIYFRAIVALVFIAASIPQSTSAQCTCAGGIPATTIRNVVSLAPTNLPSATISMPQFNPTVMPGFDLSCVTMFDTLTIQATSGARNLNSSTALLPPSNSQYSPTGRMEYAFVLPMTANVVGPGFTQAKTITASFGPDSLGAFGQPDDTITYGPSNIFVNVTGSKASTNVGAYIGTGTVSLSYSTLGNLVATQGSSNFTQTVRTLYSGNFGLLYYLCPSSPLATSISYFSAVKNNKSVDLQWLAANLQNNTLYEIQYSKNGEDFSPVGNISAGTTSAGIISEYHYQYNLNPTDVGAVYFRIKRIEPDGHVSYSAVKLINLESSGSLGIQTYPNPVVNTVKVQFASNQTGHFMLELINISGQVIQQKAVSMNGNSQTDFDLVNHPAKGLYVLRARNMASNKQYITKVQIQ
jgi:hypothetical protein